MMYRWWPSVSYRSKIVLPLIPNRKFDHAALTLGGSAEGYYYCCNTATNMAEGGVLYLNCPTVLDEGPLIADGHCSMSG
jgi:hypothetical protein